MRKLTLSVLALASLASAASLSLQPDDRITPGAVGNSNVAAVCEIGYSKSVRHTTAAMKQRVRRLYGVAPKAGTVEYDHRIPLELGGADSVSNIWPEPYTGSWNAHVKDRLENWVHTRVCVQRTMTLPEAQQLFRGDWTKAYRDYISRR